MLGFQSRCVNAGSYAYAFGCSTVIGFSQAYVWKHVTTSTDNFLSALVYSQAGAFAICTAIYVHKRLPKK